MRYSQPPTNIRGWAGCRLSSGYFEDNRSVRKISIPKDSLDVIKCRLALLDASTVGETEARLLSTRARGEEKILYRGVHCYIHAELLPLGHIQQRILIEVIASSHDV